MKEIPPPVTFVPLILLICATAYYVLLVVLK